VNWAEVRKAFHEIGYTGWINAELPNGDEDYLKEVNRRMKLIGQGARSI
jgi:sugar phosphate isomerase/epimerase